MAENRHNGSTLFSTTMIAWQYDDLDRLTQESYSQDSADSATPDVSYVDDYAFDRSGNRIVKAHNDTSLANTGDETTTSTYNDRDELTTADSTVNTNNATFSYDANGSTITKISGGQTTTYGYDLRNRMVTVDTGGTLAPEVKYAYDSDGNRVLKQTGIDGVMSQSTYHLVDTHNSTSYAQVLEEAATQVGAPTRSYLIGQDVIGQADASSTAQYIMYDGHGSTRALLDGIGTIVAGQTFDFDAYGNAGSSNPANPSTTLLYSGELWDPTIGMQYLRARYYDPTVGRFHAADTIAISTGDTVNANRYLYVADNAPNAVDPSGHDLVSVLSTLAINGLLNGLRLGVVGAAAGARAGAIDAALGGQDIVQGAIGGAKFGGAVGFGIGFLGPFATTFLAPSVVSGLASLGF